MQVRLWGAPLMSLKLKRCHLSTCAALIHDPTENCKTNGTVLKIWCAHSQLSLCVVNSLIHFCTERKCLLCLYPALPLQSQADILACLQLLLAAISLWMYDAWILVAVHLAYFLFFFFGCWNTKITWAQFSPVKAVASPVDQLIWCKDLWLTGSSLLLHAGRHYSYLYVTLTRVNFVVGVVAA